MNTFNTLKIGIRLGVGFGILAAFMIILAAFSLLRMSAIADTVEFQNEVRIEKLEQLYIAREALAQTGLSASNALAITDDAEAMQELDRMDAQKAAYLAALKKLSPHFTGDARFQKISAGLLKMASGLDRVRPLRDTGRMKELGDFIAYENRPLHNQTVAVMEEVLRSVQQNVNTASEESRSLFAQSIAWILFVSCLALLAGIVVATLITRGLLRQLGGEPNAAAAIAGQIARGNLAIFIPTRENDTASLLFAIKTMRDNLASVVGQVRGGTDTMVTASNQIAAGNRDLSGRTERQAGSLQETASSLEELTSTVKQNADNARQASQLALSASEIAMQGGSVVNQVVDTMNAIDASSRKISDIIGVIDSIAFQTNILALNAAVEAARAGVQGSGFAVVASEVRNLAQRSAAAAGEIKSMIGDSVKEVGAGSKLAEQAGRTMAEVVASVKRVTDIVDEISSASQEQREGIEQINHAIASLDATTQQNAALVEESATAAQSLHEQAASLARIVSVFKLDGMRNADADPVAQTLHAVPRRLPFASRSPS
jgi:methyl-accepting chemotaxis protein